VRKPKSVKVQPCNFTLDVAGSLMALTQHDATAAEPRAGGSCAREQTDRLWSLSPTQTKEEGEEGYTVRQLKLLACRRKVLSTHLGEHAEGGEGGFERGPPCLRHCRIVDTELAERCGGGKLLDAKVRHRTAAAEAEMGERGEVT